MKSGVFCTVTIRRREVSEVAATEARVGTERILDVSGLKKYFPIEKGFMRRVVGHVKAVDDVDFFIRKGETLGLVGESGCGKTTLGRCIVRAMQPTAGEVKFQLPDGSIVNLAAMSYKELKSVRRHFHMIFQDPFSSLDPRMTVLDIIGEPLKYNGYSRGEETVNRVKELMSVVGLEVQHLKRYPHAFSGGQRQRIGIARSLAPNPSLVVCDEAVSALDVSIQAQILNLLQELQDRFRLTYLFIAHDLSVIEHISDRVAVMYVGKMTELAETEELFLNPRHPYTEALLSAVPKTDPRTKMKRLILPGEVANPANPPKGCYFHPRCKYAQSICKNETPEWKEVSPGHFSTCHLSANLTLKGVEDLPQSE
jgi:peptide/nickel transport system ATP-binding protein